MTSTRRRWEPHDRDALNRIRQFELHQPGTTSATTREHVAVLQDAQAILLNLTSEALKSPDIRDEDTPAFFLLHTIIDDLRQAELNLQLGYTIAVTYAMRDALEAIALAALFARDPARAARYFEGDQNWPADVRRDLEKSGVDDWVIAWLWFSYDFLSQFTHPNVERLVHVMDERETDTGVVRTYNAGGTNDPRKLRLVANLSVMCIFPLLWMAAASTMRFVGEAERRALQSSVRDAARKSRALIEQSPITATGDAAANSDPVYYQRLKKRFAKQQAMLDRVMQEAARLSKDE